MGKSTYFIGQPIFSQLLFLLNKTKISRISQKTGSNRYIKRFDSYTHLVTMLYAVIGHFDSIREVVIGLLSNAHKLSHLGISYCAKRSTLSDANRRRSSTFFKEVYQSLYQHYKSFLSDSRMKTVYANKLYVMDSTTISLFKQILKGAGRNPKRGKKKGGLKAHTIIKYDENIPYLVRYTSAATHDHVLLKEVDLPQGSFITFDMGYVNYKVYQHFTLNQITYVTKMKSNASYQSTEEFDVPELADAGILKDERIVVRYGKNKELTHTSRRIAYWNSDHNKLEVFMTNNTELSAEDIVEIYRRRWVIEMLFKQLKQNFPLKYFLGDNVNAIEIQIWVTLIANLLFSVLKSRIKQRWAFSNMVTFVRINLMSYIHLYEFLENPEKSWLAVQKAREKVENMPLFDSRGAYF
jgi:FOG: Transposase and inactivated derivatives